MVAFCSLRYGYDNYIWYLVLWRRGCHDFNLVNDCGFGIGRGYWMENTMTFLNSHFTWLEASRRSLPRPKRLQRSRLPRQKKKRILSLVLKIAKGKWKIIKVMLVMPVTGYWFFEIQRVGLWISVFNVYFRVWKRNRTRGTVLPKPFFF